MAPGLAPSADRRPARQKHLGPDPDPADPTSTQPQTEKQNPAHAHCCGTSATQASSDPYHHHHQGQSRPRRLVFAPSYSPPSTSPPANAQQFPADSGSACPYRRRPTRPSQASKPRRSQSLADKTPPGTQRALGTPTTQARRRSRSRSRSRSAMPLGLVMLMSSLSHCRGWCVRAARSRTVDARSRPCTVDPIVDVEEVELEWA
ncbi:hypothetical protein HMN09_01197200 [Mycena chlorophos]|uniref:Uncharacterized protein n=1 Tax=Mycena chlorophos TaxID=658473 RepID=A0A8H6VTB4_MYCCL|nr:hypothetical protein HMN09_01197200 [Mycena chlorophos]